MSAIWVKEIFRSIQGEGTLALGKIQIFLRTAFCNLSCAYCDTNFSRSPTADVEHWGLLENPMSIDRVMSAIQKLHIPQVHSLSHTGGDPLVLNVDLLKELYRRINVMGIPVYLETGGVLHRQLEVVIPWVRYVSMDLKLPSATKMKPYWDEHKEFLKIVHFHRKEAYVKAVFCNETTLNEIRDAVEVLKPYQSQYPLVLQPASPHRAFPDAVSQDQVLRVMEYAQKLYPNTVAIPQTHKLLSLR